MAEIKLPKIIPWWVHAIVIALILLALFIGGYKLKGVLEENKDLKAQQKTMLDRIERAEAANKRQDQVFMRRDEQQNEVRSGVADVTVRIKQEKANDPTTRAVLTTRLPDGLRRALRQAPAGTAAERAGVDRGDEDRGAARVNGRTR